LSLIFKNFFIIFMERGDHKSRPYVGVFFEFHQNEAGGVPDLVDKIAVGADLVVGNDNITGGSNAINQGKAEGIGTVFSDISSGSTTLPLLLLIFWPLASTTRE